jgi:hypothetical protein
MIEAQAKFKGREGPLEDGQGDSSSTAQYCTLLLS